MTKLSRKDKYKDLRQSIEQESEKSQASHKVSRLNRMAAPDFRAEQRKETRQDQNPVIEDLLGEVKQYNLNNGELVIEDTQMQILHDLSAKEQAARRSEHFETMEPNDDEGGTTRNLFGSDLSSLVEASKTPAKPALKPKPILESVPAQEDTLDSSALDDTDYLDLFTPGQNANLEVSEKEIEVDPALIEDHRSLFGKPRKNRKKSKEKKQVLFDDTEDNLFDPDVVASNSKPAQAAEPEEDEDDLDYFSAPATSLKSAPKEKAAWQDEEDTPPASRAAMIFMVVCCVVLVILIILVIYWMSKLGIF